MFSVYAFATEGQDVRKDNKEMEWKQKGGDETAKKVRRYGKKGESKQKKKPVLVDVKHGYDPRGQ